MTVAGDRHTTAGKLADLNARYDEAVHAGSERAVERQHAQGKKTARERIAPLLDEGSFIELDEFARHRSTTFGMDANRPYGDGVVTGYGTVDGRPVCVFSQDFTVFGGCLGEVYGEKIVKVMDFAMKNGCPVIGINEGGGARIQEGVVALGLYGEIFYRNVQASGVIPQISLIMGAAAGGHVYSPALTDFVVMVDKTSQMFITGPDVIKTVTGEDVTLEELGGARTHNTLSGNAHYLGADEDDAIDYVKALLSYLPSNNLDPLPVYDTEVSDRRSTPRTRSSTRSSRTRPTSPTTCTEIIEHLLDDGEFLEVQALFAPNIVVGFGRVEGHPVGVVANQPMHFAGCLDIDASEKAARFVRTCDAFNVPVLTFVDVPGFLPGVGQEWRGIIRRGAKLHLRLRRGDRPEGHGHHPQGLRRRVRRHGLQAPRRGRQPRLADRADRGDGRAGRGQHPATAASSPPPTTPRRCGRRSSPSTRTPCVNPYIAAERGYVDSVIPPSQTRAYVIKRLRMLRNKRADPAAQEAREHPAVTSSSMLARRGIAAASLRSSAGATSRHE